MENIYEVPEGDSVSDDEGETSFSEATTFDTCPTGLYCVIDDFLSEYELRLLKKKHGRGYYRNRTIADHDVFVFEKMESRC